MCMSNGGSGGGAAEQRRAENQRQDNIRAGTADINQRFDSQFTDDYFTGRRKAYLDYATPQLEDQYADTRKQLTYFLDRNGTLDSSSRTTKEAELQKDYDVNKRAVNDQGLAYENDARTKVADARTNLIGMLTSTGDNTASTNAAIGRSSALTQPEAYSPIGNMFANFTGALGHQVGLERADAYAGTGVGQPRVGRYNMFGPGKDSVKVI